MSGPTIRGDWIIAWRHCVNTHTIAITTEQTLALLPTGRARAHQPPCPGRAPQG